MRPRLIAFCAIAAIALAIPLAILALGRAATTVAEAPGVALGRLADAALGIFQNKTRVDISATAVTITPLSEIALAQLGLRENLVYRRSWLGSECVVVAEQDFRIKFGYDSSAVFSLLRGGGGITVPAPKVLSIEPRSGAPGILYSSSGIYNQVAAEDMLAIGNQLLLQARQDARLAEYQAMLQRLIATQLKTLRDQIDRPSLRD